MLVLLAVYGVFNISFANTFEKHCQAIIASLAELKNSNLAANTSEAVKKAQDEYVVEAEDTVWAIANLNYRTGPGESYKKVDTLNAYTKLTRTGTTKNGWSRVVVDDKDYFVSTEFLTTKAPVEAKGEYQQYALSLLSDFGWDESEIVPLVKLWNRESGWKPNAHNKYSGAHGIPQALPASKMASEGSDYYTNGKTQIRWGLKYIKERYGSPSNAWAHSQRTGWY